jgi:hypothetical protein
VEPDHQRAQAARACGDACFQLHERDPRAGRSSSAPCPAVWRARRAAHQPAIRNVAGVSDLLRAYRPGTDAGTLETFARRLPAPQNNSAAGGSATPTSRAARSRIHYHDSSRQPSQLSGLTSSSHLRARRNRPAGDVLPHTLNAGKRSSTGSARRHLRPRNGIAAAAPIASALALVRRTRRVVVGWPFAGARLLPGLQLRSSPRAPRAALLLVRPMKGRA